MLAANLVAHRKRMTPFTTTSRQNIPASFSLHARAKAVILQTLPAARVSIGRLHACVSPLPSCQLEKPFRLSEPADSVKLDPSREIPFRAATSLLIDTVENFV